MIASVSALSMLLLLGASHVRADGAAGAEDPNRAATIALDPNDLPLFKTPAILAIERQIEDARDELRKMIGERSRTGSELASDPRLRELAEHLPRLQAELRSLQRRAER